MEFFCGCIGNKSGKGVCMRTEEMNFGCTFVKLNHVHNADPVAKRSDYFEDVSASFALNHSGPKLVGRYDNMV